MVDTGGATRDTVDLDVPGGTRARADEWALVLASEGIACRIGPGAGGYVLTIPSGDAARALDVIEAYVRENPPRAVGDRGEETEPLPPPGFAGVWVALALVACHWLAGRQALHDLVYERGSADAFHILEGEWWRTITALLLHADLGHVAGNALFGVYFVTQVTRSLGAGVGLFAIVAAGATGNLLNAIGHAGSHHSIGASTAVFGAIGILAGMALARRNRAGHRGARLLLPVGAGLGLLAMLGVSGARVDVWAHLYGLLAGGLIGVAARLEMRRRPGPAVQLAVGVAAVGLVVAAVALAWRG